MCGRESAEKDILCGYHKEALNRLRIAFGDWKRAMEIGWDDYVNAVRQLEEAGTWVREVIDYITSGHILSEP